MEVKEEKPKILKFGGFIEKEYKTAGDEILDEQMPFSELKVLTHFVSGIKKEFPVEIEFIEVNNAPEKDNKGWKDILNNVTPGNPCLQFE